MNILQCQSLMGYCKVEKYFLGPTRNLFIFHLIFRGRYNAVEACLTGKDLNPIYDIEEGSSEPIKAFTSA